MTWHEAKKMKKKGTNKGLFEFIFFFPNPRKESPLLRILLLGYSVNTELSKSVKWLSTLGMAEICEMFEFFQLCACI